MLDRSKLKRVGKLAAAYVAIVGITLVLLDVVLIAFGILPPKYNYGDPDIGWIPAAPTGGMVIDRCAQYMTGTMDEYIRNDRGVRTPYSTDEILADSSSYRIAVTGDSQTELCAPNPDTHFGFLERQLREHDIPAISLAYAAGRYSPLQSYLAFKKELSRYQPQVLVLNVYTGNDLYDILRVDDRPYLKPDGDGYHINPPEWYIYDDPSVKQRSRILALGRALLKKTGVTGSYLRLKFFGKLAREQGADLGTVFDYLNDLRGSMEPSVGYPAAFSAQILNQQLFFHYFPGARSESLRMMRALMELARRENPDMVLVLSALPSYQLVTPAAAADSSFRATIERLPVPYEQGAQMESELYDALGVLANETGWLFVDHRPGLRAYEGQERLYNDFDYHFTVPASAIIGQAQAEVILQHLTAPGAVQ